MSMSRTHSSLRSSNRPSMARSRWLHAALVSAVAATLLLVLSNSIPAGLGFSWTSKSVRSGGMLFRLPTDLSDTLVKRLDCILVLGGGVPLKLDEPPVYAQRRCDDAAALVARHRKLRPGTQALTILCLSAGTAHLPQLLSPDGLPLWESTASAAYLQKRYSLIDNVYVETTSYDTIGNAFFARTTHTDVAGWRCLLIVTNEFHMERTKAIFDWIFGVDNNGYELNYLASENVGVTKEGLEARRPHEEKGTRTVKDKLAPQHTSMAEVYKFLTTKHDFYTAEGLVKRAKAKRENSLEISALKESYGAAFTSTQEPNSKG